MNDMTTMDRRTAPMPAPEAQGGALQLHRPAPVALSMGDFLSSIATPEAIQQQKRFSALYDQACDALIGENDVQHEAGKTFKKKSAWRKLARFFQVSTEILRVEKGWRQTPDGRDYYYAEATVRATAPWGQSMEATAACDTLEPRFKSDKAKQKAGNDCLATAETRATNRAVSNLIAAGEVSAEEMEDADFDRDRGGRERGNSHSGSGSGRSGGDRTTTTTTNTSGEPACPVCGKAMWDNTQRCKENEAAGKKPGPQYKCKDRDCTGVYWMGQWRPEEDGGALNALADKLRDLVEDIRALDPKVGEGAEGTVEELLQRADVTEADIKKLGGQLKRRLDGLQKAPQQPEVGNVADLPAEEAEMDAINAALEQDASA